MAKKNRHTLLKGEGIHQHTLVGNFTINENETEFTNISVSNDSDLVHEKPDGSFGEHKTLKVVSGKWKMGKQVEYNPFDGRVTQIWD